MDIEALVDLMDGKGELAGALASNEIYTKRLIDQLRFQHEVLAEIHELSGAASGDAFCLIRTKAHVALRAAAQSGLLT